MIKLLLTDLDGTLTEDRGTYVVDIDAIKALRRAEKAGIRVALVSGNSYPVLRGLHNYLGLSGGLVAENGCFVFHGGVTFRVCETVPREVVSEFAKTFNLRESWQNEFRRSDFGFTPAELKDEMIKWAEERGLVVQSSGYALHLSGKPGGKGAGVRKLLELANVKREETGAIGDSRTDIEMFREAGITAAVSNADPELKRVASISLKLKSGAGVMEFIDMLLS
ncbi:MULTISPECIES: phosphoglycolate phosphatase [Metallosphaera]|uniref:phosphoglycolate phosphatase n=1 Tax=Metallosphaera TaxID=41980 RepID=UPI001F065A6B|nr:phosphoglycolate phosphatase [Metallosphaera sedula]MCH1770595.1 phosphoglycolate phosphatase [Metallosphaera sedula]MCP6728793.1 phosphoglycolate phosphatase [Metallosphaera sedula]